MNVRFACDGEEETGGHSIVEFLEADERGADAAVIFDSGMIARDRPAFDIATRGMSYFHVTLRSGERDLHSGIYGGAALNAAHALIQTLSAVIAPDGRLAEPLREGITPPSEAELASWRELPAGAGELADQGARPADPSAADEFYLRTFAEPSLDVNGIETGSPHLEKTVLPVQAVANVSIRLAPGQQVEKIAEAFTRMLHEAAPLGADLDVKLLSDGAARDRPARCHGDPARSERVRTGARGAAAADPLRAARCRSWPRSPTSGSRPSSRASRCRTRSLHSPNECLLAEYVPRGIAAARALFEEFAAL